MKVVIRTEDALSAAKHLAKCSENSVKFLCRIATFELYEIMTVITSPLYMTLRGRLQSVSRRKREALILKEDLMKSRQAERLAKQKLVEFTSSPDLFSVSK